MSFQSTDFNESKYIELMYAISSFNGKLVNVRRIKDRCNLNPQQITHMMPLLVDCGAISEHSWCMVCNTNRRRHIIYRRLFEKEEIDSYLSKMKFISAEKEVKK